MHVFDLKKFIDGFVAEVLPRHGRSKSRDRPWFAPTRRDFAPSRLRVLVGAEGLR